MAPDRPSLIARMKDGFTITPAWAAIFVSLILAAVAAGATGLQTASATEVKVEALDRRQNRIEADVQYIRVRIDTLIDRQR